MESETITTPGIARPKPRGRWIFLAWLGFFYVVWFLIVALGEHWYAFREHWAIGAAMALGSYFAGSTPLGGGTVGFPVLVLLFGEPASMGRDFSFAIQSIGMTSAAILIFCMRQPVEKRMLVWACVGSTIGTPLGLMLLAPSVPGLWVKLIFAVTWAAFGMLHFAKIREIASAHGLARMTARFERRAGFFTGLLAGSTIAATTGVGIDLAIYVVLVLMCRADLKIAIPTSVVLMAFTSVVGVLVRTVMSWTDPTRFAFSDDLFGNWIVAAPIVALGAPFGVLMVRLIPKSVTLLVVSGLCLIQLAWTYWTEREQLTTPIIVVSLIGLVGLNVLFMVMYEAGRRRVVLPASTS